MNQVDQNINKDMNDSDLIDVETLDFSDEQTWLYKVPNDSGEKMDIVDWSLSLEWPVYDDVDYQKTEKILYGMLDDILKNQILAMPDKHKFDSRTYVKPKKRMLRPSIQSIVESPPNPSSLTNSGSKYLTYNKYNSPLGPMLRLKTFNVDANTDNSSAVKEYAAKRRSLVHDEDPQMENEDTTLVSDVSDRLSLEPQPSKPINIDLSQPAHNIHNTFNKGFTNILNERGSLNMYQSGEFLMRMSPPSLVSSLMMESSGTFNPESMDSKKSMPSQRDSGLPLSTRDSIDPMMSSMTLSILDEKDMSTSFLSQTTYPDNDSLIDSLPPSLVSSVNSSYIISNTSKPRESTDSNVFSSATFTHLEQSEKLLSARPRAALYNSYTKREAPIRNCESYTKAREEACQIDATKVLNENASPKTRTNEMGETITLHYSNNKFKDNDAEKENLSSSFEKDDAFYRDMGMQKAVDPTRNSLKVTLDKQELNEIIQARQKLSLARKALPTEVLPNQVETSPVKTSLNQTLSFPRKSVDTATDLLARRKAVMNGKEDRDPPKRDATFRRPSPKANSIDATVVYVKPDEHDFIDINSATFNLVDSGDGSTLHQDEWCGQERAMVGSTESTDTGTFSSSSPPDTAQDTLQDPKSGIPASTPLISLKASAKTEMLDLHTMISPIYDYTHDKSYVVNMPSTGDGNATVINSATIVRKSAAKRDILAMRASPEKRDANATVTRNIVRPSMPASNFMAPPGGLPRKTSLPTSKLRQYSSHKDLRLPLAGNAAPRAPGRAMQRRAVYASNPALSPTKHTAPMRRDSYTIACPQPQTTHKEEKPAVQPHPLLVRQGTETLRRERPQSQLVQPKDLRGIGAALNSGGCATGAGASAVPMRTHQAPQQSRPYSIAGVSQLRGTSRPSTVPPQRSMGPSQSEPRPWTGAPAAVSVSGAAVAVGAGGERVSALPRPSRLPAPRRALRPPSVYSVAPSSDMDHY